MPVSSRASSGALKRRLAALLAGGTAIHAVHLVRALMLGGSLGSRLHHHRHDSHGLP